MIYINYESPPAELGSSQLELTRRPTLNTVQDIREN